jgi:hypothetical protein
VRVSAGILQLKFASAFGLVTRVIGGAGQAVIWLGLAIINRPNQMTAWPAPPITLVTRPNAEANLSWNLKLRPYLPW